MYAYLPGQIFEPPEFPYTIVHLNETETITLTSWGPLVPSMPYDREEDCKVGDLWIWTAEAKAAKNTTGQFVYHTFNITFDTHDHDHMDKAIVTFDVYADDKVHVGEWHTTVKACLKVKPDECYEGPPQIIKIYHPCHDDVIAIDIDEPVDDFMPSSDNVHNGADLADEGTYDLQFRETTTYAGHQTDILDFTITHSRGFDPDYVGNSDDPVPYTDENRAWMLDRDECCHVECSVEVHGNVYIEAQFDNKGWDPTQLFIRSSQPDEQITAEVQWWCRTIYSEIDPTDDTSPDSMVSGSFTVVSTPWWCRIDNIKSMSSIERNYISLAYDAKGVTDISNDDGTNPNTLDPVDITLVHYNYITDETMAMGHCDFKCVIVNDGDLVTTGHRDAITAVINNSESAPDIVATATEHSRYQSVG